jgi:hypothetical protein
MGGNRTAGGGAWPMVWCCVGGGGVLRGRSERGRMQGRELGEAELFSAFLSRVREASWAILGLRPQAKLFFSQMVRRSSGYAPGHGPGCPGPRSAPVYKCRRGSCNSMR